MSFVRRWLLITVLGFSGGIIFLLPFLFEVLPHGTWWACQCFRILFDDLLFSRRLACRSCLGQKTD
jgi:hypothetical protein